MKTINVKPTAKVAIKRNVLKQYKVGNVDTVFMPNGTEFELELFNPTTETIMCKISLNGKQEEDGIVLYPGQRIFLERYLSNNNKFKYVTYNIDAENDEALNAIIKNGEIKVEFFKESTYTFTISSTPNVFFYQSNPILGINTCASGYTTSITTNTISTNTGSDNGSYNVTSEVKKETGVISKGDKSKQDFNNVYNDFSLYPFQTVNIKILPDSQKLIEADDLKHKKYCSECGKKVNHNDKYCSYCGKKL